jgi:hypothetical protein
MGSKLYTLALLTIDGIVILEIIAIGVAIVLVLILLFCDAEVIVTIKLEVIVLGLRGVSPSIYKEAYCYLRRPNLQPHP